MGIASPLMSSSTNTTRQYPVPCPKCDESKGYPYQVRTMSDHSGAIEIRLRCRDCNHEWIEVTPSRE
jgi:DNA-directed RNA polymerase subunit M/transcription elongation factor TFIIS